MTEETTETAAPEKTAAPEATVEDGTAARPRSSRPESSLQMTSMKKSHLKSSVKLAPITERPIQPLPYIPLWIKDWIATIIIGAFTTSHWRGLWTLFDLWTCDQPETATLASGENFCFAATFFLDPKDKQTRLDSGIFTYWLGVVLTIVGVALVWAGLWTPPPDCNGKVTIARAVIRWLIAYTLCVACVCQWRGIWYITDDLVWIDYPLQSYWLTTCVGAAVAFLLISGNALLAPPAIFLIDGPGLHQPPIAVTIMSSYYSVKLEAGEKPPERSVFALLLDALVSFIGLPIMVVWYWRGCWLLQDWYFWAFTPEHQDVLVSLGWSTLLGVLCAIFASEPILSYITKPMEKSHFAMAVMGRLRTLVLAIGCVAFWRVVWSLWDLNGTSNASVWSSEVVSVFCMTAMGCVTSLTAPPSTLGVDVTPNPKCADEPLFAMLPIPWELLAWWGIGRQPKVVPVLEDASELELTEIEAEGEDVAMPLATPGMRASVGQSLNQSLSSRVSSLRESLSESVSLTYFETQRPSMEMQEVWVEGNAYLQQRPSIDNLRHRSSFFRNR